MNVNEFTPDNNSTCKLKEGDVVDSLLFITNQEFAEAVEKRVSHLNNPAACMKVWIAFQLLLLLATRPNVRNIIPLLHCFSSASIACIQAQILRMLFIWLRAWHYDMIQRFVQQFDIMRMGPQK